MCLWPTPKLSQAMADHFLLSYQGLKAFQQLKMSRKKRLSSGPDFVFIHLSQFICYLKIFHNLLQTACLLLWPFSQHLIVA